ncbi:MAG: hypothetical protein ACRDRZ_07900 [Pseudonocardiaceae bacterium]
MKPARPARAAVVEIALAAVLAGIAVQLWGRGVIVTATAGAVLSRVDGRWWAGAVAVATLGGLLLLDAWRRVVPGTRPHHGDDLEVVVRETELTAPRTSRSSLSRGD